MFASVGLRAMQHLLGLRLIVAETDLSENFGSQGRQVSWRLGGRRLPRSWMILGTSQISESDRQRILLHLSLDRLLYGSCLRGILRTVSEVQITFRRW